MTPPVLRNTLPMRFLAAWRLFLDTADKQSRNALCLATLLVVLSGILTAVAPMALSTLVDDFNAHAASDRRIVALLTAYVVALWAARALGEWRTRLHVRAEQSIQRSLSRRLLAHLLRLRMQFHLDRKTGALTQMLANGLAGHKIMLHHAVHTAIPGLIELTATIVIIGLLGKPILVFLFIGISIAYVVAFARSVSRVAAPARAVATAHLASYAVLSDSLLNCEAIKCCGAELGVEQRYDRALARTESLWLRYYRRTTRDGLVIATIFAGSIACAMGVAAPDVARGTMSVGEFVLINAYLLRIVTPLEALGAASRDVFQGLAYLQKLMQVFDQPQEPQGGRTLAHSRGASTVVFEHVSLCYEGGRSALRDVSFSIDAGTTVAIVGPSGSGKSSLVRVLLRLHEPSAGRILLDGVPTSELSVGDLRRQIALVPQDTILLNDTAAANIALGAYAASPADVERAARLARLHELMRSLPKGYETQVGERGLKLSGGERQRVAIARAILRNPQVYVFDEATSSLDATTELEVMTHLAEISAGTTTLMVTHRLASIVGADQIMVLDRGRIVECGTHRQLLRRGGCYAALWNAQLRDALALASAGS